MALSVIKKEQRLLSCLKCQSGMTLIELMIVIAIIGVLAAIATPQYHAYIERTRYTVAMTNLRYLDREIRVFAISNGRFPDSLTEMQLDHVKDPWGNPYEYLNIQTTKGLGNVRKKHSTVPVNTDYDLYSMGPDGKSQSPFTAKVSRDDLVRANDGAFFGKVSEY